MGRVRQHRLLAAFGLPGRKPGLAGCLLRLCGLAACPGAAGPPSPAPPRQRAGAGRSSRARGRSGRRSGPERPTGLSAHGRRGHNRRCGFLAVLGSPADPSPSPRRRPRRGSSAGSPGRPVPVRRALSRWRSAGTTTRSGRCFRPWY
jgi:hypothetical protein